MNYRKGYARELRARRDLESGGWYVIRSAGSRGLVDLVALKSGPGGVLVRLIQVKPSRGRCPEGLWELPRGEGVVCVELWVWDGGRWDVFSRC